MANAGSSPPPYTHFHGIFIATCHHEAFLHCRYPNPANASRKPKDSAAVGRDRQMEGEDYGSEPRPPVTVPLSEVGSCEKRMELRLHYWEGG